MLLALSIPMTRKILALMVVLIIAGFAPATAVIGFCAKMPCCFGQTHGGPALAVNMADCCSTISCYEAPPHDVTMSAKAKVFTATTLASLPVTLAMPQVAVARRTFDDTSPPPTTSERLSSLSVFLI